VIITVAGFKGGVAKTTTAVHLAAFLAGRAKTAVIDGDENRSATAWANRGQLPFPVVDARQTARAAREYEHLVIDTQARPSRNDLAELAGGCDLLILPSTPDAMALDALTLTIAELQALKADRYRILLTVVPPPPSHDGEEARRWLKSEGLPVFRAEIRRRSAFVKAALAGSLVQNVRDPRAELGWQDYAAAGKELMK
jgi:chromosome partitioning protein